jgi:hypothetical protein
MAAFWTLMKDATMAKAEQKPTTPITIWGPCYDHKMFLPVLAKKGVFLKNQFSDTNLAKIATFW